MSFIVLPTLVLVLQLTRRNSPFVPLHVAEQALRIPASGDVVLDLSDLLAFPTRVYPRVYLNVPAALHVRAIPSLQRAAPEARCENHRCTLELLGLTRPLRDVSLRVDQPGRYEIKLERSDGSRLRKDVLVLHVSR